MRLINLIRRMCLGFVIWSTEQHIEDLARVMRETNSVNHFRSAAIEIHAARKDLANARREYSALLPIGVIQGWKIV